MGFLYLWSCVNLSYCVGGFSLTGPTTVNVRITGLTPGPHGFHLVRKFYLKLFSVVAVILEKLNVILSLSFFFFFGCCIARIW